MRSTAWVMMTVIAMSFTAVASRGQTLNHMRRQVREPAPSSPAPESTRDEEQERKSSRYVYDEDEDTATDDFMGKMLLMGLSAPFVVPRAALGDTGADVYFPDHPYDGEQGSMASSSDNPGVHNSLVVLQTDFGTDFDSLSHGHGRISGEHVSRFGLDSEFFYRHEDLAVGSDSLWHGDANLTYRFAQNEHWQFRVGAGINWLSDSSGTDAGFNTTYSAEWFPGDPWMLSSTLDLGRLGRSSLIHFRNTVGVTHNGWGIFTGHDYFRLGSLRINSWINGVEYRF